MLLTLLEEAALTNIKLHFLANLIPHQSIYIDPTRDSQRVQFYKQI